MNAIQPRNKRGPQGERWSHVRNQLSQAFTVHIAPNLETVKRPPGTRQDHVNEARMRPAAVEWAAR